MLLENRFSIYKRRGQDGHILRKQWKMCVYMHMVPGAVNYRSWFLEEMILSHIWVKLVDSYKLLRKCFQMHSIHSVVLRLFPWNQQLRFLVPWSHPVQDLEGFWIRVSVVQMASLYHELLLCLAHVLWGYFQVLILPLHWGLVHQQFS